MCFDFKMYRISKESVSLIESLRYIGKSIPEIVRSTGFAKTTVQRYARNMEVGAEFKSQLREKQGGAKDRAQGLRLNIQREASFKLGELSPKDYLILLIGLYWGEGTKRDFEIINSDPALIQSYILCLQNLGIRKERISFTLRVHSNVDIQEAKKFWTSITSVQINSGRKVEIIEGKKKGKLKYGMCRVRVQAGIRERLLIQNMILLIGKDSDNKLVS